jgi:hypothetical protein
MVTKSGTNGFHGSLVFWNTNTSLNALSYFSKQSINNPATGPVTKGKIRGIVPYISFNRYRGVGSGPLVIPKLYNGRNKTFWTYSGDYFFMPYSRMDCSMCRAYWRGSAIFRICSPSVASTRSSIRFRRWRHPAATSPESARREIGSPQTG